jgi:hypothetical protein
MNIYIILFILIFFINEFFFFILKLLLTDLKRDPTSDKEREIQLATKKERGREIRHHSHWPATEKERTVRKSFGPQFTPKPKASLSKKQKPN